MNDVLLDPIFNLQTVPPIEPGKTLADSSTQFTQLLIETARPIVLTQDRAKLLNPTRNYVYLPPSASVKIHADEVTVCGKLSFPGQNLVIFTRVLGAEDDGSNPAEISVDGPPLPDGPPPNDKAHPKALGKGVSPPNKPDTVKVTMGQPEWSARDHPKEMNGEDGKKGETGNAAGNVWICCQKTSFHGTEHKLTIRAKGGQGGDGQPGQEGAKGGPGKNGRSAKELYTKPPEPGTKGGDGGNGGKGGKGGQGGNGGSILFHCIASQPAVAVNCQGGDPGARGEGGKHGEFGEGGKGGRGGEIASGSTMYGPVWSKVPDALDGNHGHNGSDGLKGDEADPSNPGSSTMTWGEVDSAALVQMASITQLQMLFERTRADYLVTEPPNYSLRLMAAAPPKNSGSSAPDLVDEGTNLVVVGRSGYGLHIRIFDGSGQIVADKQEAEMINGQKRFQISMADVLEAGGWVTPEDLDRMSAQDRRALMSSAGQRKALVGQLSRISGLEKDTFNKLNDYDLTGRGAVAAFVLQMGIRDEAGFKGDPECGRNTLIVEVAGKCGYDGLQARKDLELVQLALEPNEQNKFVLRGGMVLLRHRLLGTEKVAALKKLFEMSLSDVLGAGGWVAPSRLSSMSIQDQRKALIDQLSRISGLEKDMFNKLNDYYLTGRAAVTAFLLQMGIRDEAGLKGDSECGRNTLIVGVAGKCGYDGGYLQGLDDQQLVRLALEPKRTNHLVLRGNLLNLRDRFCDVSKMPLRKQEGTIALAAEIANYTDTWSSIGQRLEWLFHLLKAASKDYPNTPEKEHPEKALAKTIQPSVWSAINNHIDGLDYYGHTPDWVPFLSLGTYLDTFKDSVSRLDGIEKTYKDYFAAWNNQQSATKHLNTVVDSVQHHISYLGQKIDALRREKDETEGSIWQNDRARKALEESLKMRLGNFGEKVEHAFGLSGETFFNCLSQLGFASFSEPARALQGVSKAGGFLKAGFVEGGAVIGGFASAGAMVAGPFGMMLKDGAENILNDYGEHVNKQWLLQQIDVIRGDLDLKSELKDRIDGFKSYTESQRLVVELSKFQELCRQFRQSVPEEAQLRKDLDAYIENITTRNRYIDYYNALLQDCLDLLGDQRKLETRKHEVEAQLAATSNPGLPAIATFVSAIFERAKAECLYDFYLAKRAYSFWALEPYSDFFKTVQSPGAMTSTSLKSAHGNFTGQILKRLEGKGLEHASGSVTFFPPRDNSEASFGIIVVLSKESHPDFFKDLKRDNHADFELEPATYASTTPSKTFASTTGVAWSGDRPELGPSIPHPFHGMANVRLTKARPWIVGFHTGSGTITVKLTHLGAERFRSWKDEPYPRCTDNQKSEYVSHEAKDINFRYSSTGLSWSPVTGIFTPGQLFAPGTSGTADGDLGFPQPGAGLEDKKESIYAPIGPFGKWRLTVRPEDNTDNPKNKPLNWDTVEAVVIDFHVFAEGFSSELASSSSAAA